MNSKCEGEFPAKLEYFENENHGSIPPIAFYNGISAIFDGYGIYYRDVENTEQLSQHFQSLSKRLSWEFKPPEYLVNRIGYRMLRSRNENDQSKALSFFRLNTEIKNLELSKVCSNKTWKLMHSSKANCQ